MRVSLLAAAVVVTGLFSASPAALRQDVPPPRMEAMEGTLARGESHEHPFVLDANEHLRVSVDQRGIDLAVQVRDPRGATIGDFDNEFTTAGSEDVELTATTAGTGKHACHQTGGRRDRPRRIRDSRRRSAAGDRRRSRGAGGAHAAGQCLAPRGRGQARRRASAVRARAGSRRVGAGTELAVRHGARVRPRRQRAGSARQRARRPAPPEGAGAYGCSTRQWDLTIRSMPSCGRASPFCTRVSVSGRRQRRSCARRTRSSSRSWGRATCGCSETSARSRTSDSKRATSRNRKSSSSAPSRILDTHPRNAGPGRYAGLLNNGNLDRETGDYDRANELLQRALAAGERLRGPDSFYVSTTLQNLGIVARERKEFAAAEAYDTRALAIRERLVGSDHPDVAHILTNLANIYRAKGDYPGVVDRQHLRHSYLGKRGGPVPARSPCFRPATLRERTRATATCRTALDSPAPFRGARRATADAGSVDGISVTGWPLRGTMFERTDRDGVAAPHSGVRSDPDAASLAMLVLLQRKGRVLDAMTDTLTAVRRPGAEVRDHRDSSIELRNATMRDWPSSR